MKKGTKIILRASALMTMGALMLQMPAYADDDNAATTQDTPMQGIPMQTAPVQNEMPVHNLSDEAPSAGSASAQTVPMISGGVGDADEMALSQQQNQYNLKLLFTEGNGMYLSDVQVHISDKAGQPVADTVTNGPILLAKLPAGKYKVTAVSEGETKEQKITVGGGLHTYQFRYPTKDAED